MAIYYRDAAKQFMLENPFATDMGANQKQDKEVEKINKSR